MEEKKERKAVAKKIFEPMMKEWEPISPKMPEPELEEVAEEIVESEKVVEEIQEEILGALCLYAVCYKLTSCNILSWIKLPFTT